jgi:hypothetical protein
MMKPQSLELHSIKNRFGGRRFSSVKEEHHTEGTEVTEVS